MGGLRTSVMPQPWTRRTSRKKEGSLRQGASASGVGMRRTDLDRVDGKGHLERLKDLLCDRGRARGVVKKPAAHDLLHLVEDDAVVDRVRDGTRLAKVRNLGVDRVPEELAFEPGRRGLGGDGGVNLVERAGNRGEEVWPEELDVGKEPGWIARRVAGDAAEEDNE
jgi:hypothetical protein